MGLSSTLYTSLLSLDLNRERLYIKIIHFDFAYLCFLIVKIAVRSPITPTVIPVAPTAAPMKFAATQTVLFLSSQSSLEQSVQFLSATVKIGTGFMETNVSE